MKFWSLDLLTKKRSIKILDFDIENRPLSYWYDRPTAEITAIASCWDDDKDTFAVTLLGIDEPKDMLTHFVGRYKQADIVTGHYIRVHDLPIINGALMEYGLGKLEPKMTIDTKLDLYKKGDIPATQEYLGELFGLDYEKVHMSQVKWREGNRLTTKGIAATKKRASGDVYQHMALRKYMAEKGLLKAPRMWHP